MQRRDFIKLGLGVSVAALTTRTTSALAATANPALVVVFLRGGVDALSVLPPREGTNRTRYLAVRPTIRIASPAAITNNLGLGIHPVLSAVRTLYEAGEAAFVLGAGSLNETRSHFEQMAFVEGGDPVTKRTTGYLNRALAALGGTAFPLQAVALQDEMPLSLRGSSPAIRVGSLDGFGVLQAPGLTPGASFTERSSELQRPPAGVNATATKIGTAAAGLAGSVAHVRAIVTAAPAVSSAATYGSGPVGSRFRDAARVIAAEPRVRIVEVDAQGFDLHAMQGTDSGGDLKTKLDQLDQALGVFVADAKRLGFWNRTCIALVSEFGRNVEENGSKGTDHGRGGVACVLGPTTIVRGKRVLAPGGINLSAGALVDGRDLPVTTDLRAVMGEILTKHLGVASLASVFPGYSPTTPGLLV